MKKLFILFTLVFGLFLVSETNAQTKIVFAKGTSSKTITVTVPAKSEKKFSLIVKDGQVINVGVSGDIGVSKTNDFPVIYLNATNAQDGVDQTQDGEGYLSILAGRSGTFTITVSNSSNRARTFKMKIAVTNDRNDFEGGTSE
ncbi:MAG TPA: hypothetical protein PKE69_18365 [Pyrinomonadaceae bacterium]|nr:hypothetical protein [Pyrinomonadaceae bacterium]